MLLLLRPKLLLLLWVWVLQLLLLSQPPHRPPASSRHCLLLQRTLLS
jgi:hypothetical protein